MVYDVHITAIAAHALVSLRAKAPLDEIGPRLRRLRDLVQAAGLDPAGPPQARFFGDDKDDPRLDYDVSLPVRPGADDSVPDRVGELRGEWVPLHHVLELEHVGPRADMDDAFRALDEAREALGYTQSGPVTEVYVTGSHQPPGPEGHRTLLRLPYAR